VEVILLQDVEKVGLRGDVVSVAPGYARNFLLPRRLAETATPGRLRELSRRDELRARHEAQTVEQAREIADALDGRELRFDVKAGPAGVLFGSVTATTIADELWQARRIRVDRRKLDLPEPIKRVGRYQVPVELFTDVTVELSVAVVPEGGELPPEEEAPPAEPESEAAPEEAAEPEAETAPEPEEAEEPAAEEPEPTAEEPEPAPE
jgi:large subunit ribosomal protein L9